MPGRVQAREPTALSGSPTPADLPPAYVYLLGVYLGDGCISAHRRGVYRMRVHLDVRYPGIVDECEAALRAVAPRNRVGRLSRRSHYAPHTVYVSRKADVARMDEFIGPKS